MISKYKRIEAVELPPWIDEVISWDIALTSTWSLRSLEYSYIGATIIKLD